MKEKILLIPYAIAAMKRLPGRLANITIGHLPRETSRIIHFFLLKGGVVSKISQMKWNKGMPWTEIWAVLLVCKLLEDRELK